MKEDNLANFTGGCLIAKEQRRRGANPDICPICYLYLFRFYKEEKEVAKLCNEKCYSGTILCGDCKTRLVQLVTKFVKDHQRRRHHHLEKAKELLENRQYYLDMTERAETSKKAVTAPLPFTLRNFAPSIRLHAI